MGGNQSQPNATAIIGTGKGGPLDTSAGTIASRGISFTYDHAAEPALRDITLTVPAGECIVLCGASGCGKTSYTRVANGLIPSFFHGAFAGNQTTCGLDVETVPIDRLTPLVGSVFQNPKTQYFNANVTDELAFPAENIGLPAEDINRRITAVAERFGIGHLLHRSIFHLSGGQKQRIAVAAATMLGPRLVVLDEPTSNLDANAIADMRAMIEQMKDEGLTIVIAEHRLAWLNGVADRYVVFDGGHIVQDYEADEFLSLSPGCVAAMGLRALDLQPYRRRIAALASSPAADECTSVLLGTHNLTIGYKGKDGFTRRHPGPAVPCRRNHRAHGQQRLRQDHARAHVDRTHQACFGPHRAQRRARETARPDPRRIPSHARCQLPTVLRQRARGTAHRTRRDGCRHHRSSQSGHGRS